MELSGSIVAAGATLIGLVSGGIGAVFGAGKAVQRVNDKLEVMEKEITAAQTAAQTAASQTSASTAILTTVLARIDALDDKVLARIDRINKDFADRIERHVQFHLEYHPERIPPKE